MESTVTSNVNKVLVSGRIGGPLEFDHQIYGEKFYKSHIVSVRRSGVADNIPITISERLFDGDPEGYQDMRVSVTGHFRSFSKHDGVRNKHILSVFVRTISPLNEDDPREDENSIELEGYLCKETVYRRTPNNREVCDIMIASNRGSYTGKSDYIPTIAWGRTASFSRKLAVGTHITINGRIQSREYFKKLDIGEPESRTAYEVSISTMYIDE